MVQNPLEIINKAEHAHKFNTQPQDLSARNVGRYIYNNNNKTIVTTSHQGHIP